MFKSSLPRLRRGPSLARGLCLVALVMSTLALGDAWAGPGSSRPKGPGGIDPPPVARLRGNAPQVGRAGAGVSNQTSKSKDGPGSGPPKIS